MTVLVRPKALSDHKVRTFQMLIDGKWVDSADGRTIERVAPATASSSAAIRQQRAAMPSGRSLLPVAPSTMAPGRA